MFSTSKAHQFTLESIFCLLNLIAIMITQVCTDFSFNIQSGSDFALVQLFCNSHKSMFYSQQNTENMSNVSFEFDESKKEDRFGQCLPLCSIPSSFNERFALQILLL